MFLIELEMVSGYSVYPCEALLKVSSRYIIWNLVKTLSIFLESRRIKELPDGTRDGVLYSA